MKIHVGNFFTPVKDNIVKVSIAIGRPNNFTGPEIDILKPTWNMVNSHKIGKDVKTKLFYGDEEYKCDYYQLLIDRRIGELNSFLIKQYKQFLYEYKIKDGQEMELCCWCNSGSFCHRNLVYDMLEDNLKGHCL